MLLTILLATHVLSLLLWIGSLVSITRVITAGAGEEPAVQAKLAALARRIYRGVASPWMGIATIAGFAMIAVAKGAYFRFGWFHGKFTVALVMLGLHFVLGARVTGTQIKGAKSKAQQVEVAIEGGAVKGRLAVEGSLSPQDVDERRGPALRWRACRQARRSRRRSSRAASDPARSDHGSTSRAGRRRRRRSAGRPFSR